MICVALETALIYALLEHDFVKILRVAYQVGVAAYTQVGHTPAGERVGVVSGALIAELVVRGYTSEGHTCGLSV